MGRSEARRKYSVARARFHLPTDVEIEILSRLPVKSLLRCKSVCKTWYDLIESPTFIVKHLAHSTLNSNFNSTTFLLVPDQDRPGAMYLHNHSVSDGLIYVKFPYSISLLDLLVVGICNGLVCLNSSKEPLILCNPATRQLRIIPNNKWWGERNTNIKWFGYGFGFHPSADDYVLVRIVCHRLITDNRLSVRTDMYMMRSDTWKELDDTMPSAFGEDIANAELSRREVFPYSDATFSVATFVNGVLYWKARDNETIVSLDLCGQVFQKVKVPDSCSDNRWTLEELKGKLALINYAPGSEWFDVWLLNEDLRSWTYHFEVGPFSMTTNPVRDITLAGCVKSGELVLSLLTASHAKKFYLYNPKSQELKKIRNLPSGFGYYYNIYMYVETLLPVKRKNRS